MTGIKHKKNKLVFIFASLLALLGVCFSTGCQSTQGVMLADQAHPLVNIKKAIASSIPGGTRQKSQNGRELYSFYFDGNTFEALAEPDEGSERFYAKVVILGDRRPYNLDVAVYRQKKSGGIFEDVDVDMRLSKKIASDLKAKLAQSRDDTSVVDEFRAF